MRRFLSGIILAAGASKRIGAPKQLLPLAGRPLLQHVVDAAVQSRLDEIILVLGDAAAEIEAALSLPAGRHIRVVVNPDAGLGQATSLGVGLRAADAGAVGAGILLGDEPQVSPVLIDRLASAFESATVPVVRPVYTGADGRRLPGHPTFLARRIWPELKRLCGDQGARALLATHPDWVLEVEMEGERPADIDTWEDYRRIAEAGAGEG